MSLIYKALNALEPEPGAKAVADVPVPRVAVASPNRWLYVLLGLAAVAAIAVVALAIVRERMLAPSPQLAAAAPAIAVTPSLATLPAPVPSASTSLAAPAPAPATADAPAHAPTVSAMAPAQPMAAGISAVAVVAPSTLTQPAAPMTQRMQGPAVAVAQQPVATPQARHPRRLPAATRKTVDVKTQDTAATAAPPADPDAISHMVQAARQAIDTQRNDEAGKLMGELAARLPPDSMTMLRLTAWQALRGGDAVRARALYRQIVDRIPDDETASVNLAVLEWRAGEHDNARRVIARAMDLKPESPVLKRYSTQFEERR